MRRFWVCFLRRFPFGFRLPLGVRRLGGSGRLGLFSLGIGGGRFVFLRSGCRLGLRTVDDFGRSHFEQTELLFRYCEKGCAGVQGVDILVVLVGGFLVPVFQIKIPETNPGEGSHLSIFLGGDGLVVVVLGFLAVTRNMIQVSQRVESLRETRVFSKIVDELLESGPGIFGFSLVGEKLGLAQ